MLRVERRRKAKLEESQRARAKFDGAAKEMPVERRAQPPPVPEKLWPDLILIIIVAVIGIAIWYFSRRAHAT
jgi:hypothetical protein